MLEMLGRFEDTYSWVFDWLRGWGWRGLGMGAICTYIHTHTHIHTQKGMGITALPECLDECTKEKTSSSEECADEM